MFKILTWTEVKNSFFVYSFLVEHIFCFTSINEHSWLQSTVANKQRKYYSVVVKRKGSKVNKKTVGNSCLFYLLLSFSSLWISKALIPFYSRFIFTQIKRTKKVLTCVGVFLINFQLKTLKVKTKEGTLTSVKLILLCGWTWTQNLFWIEIFIRK